MSDPSAFGFSKFVPGFDFLQSLAKSASASGGASAGAPGMASWVAPTLSVEELDKRIQELKAVQFWLEQNGTALKATIQALEVQKMTLSTLQGMNVNMAELAKAFSAQKPSAGNDAATTASSASPATPPPASAQATAAEPAKAKKKTHRPNQASPAKPSASNGGGAVDPMQWWGSLTQQFQNIASAAMQDVAAEALKAPMAPSAGAASPARAGKKAAPRPVAKATKAGAKRSRSARP